MRGTPSASNRSASSSPVSGSKPYPRTFPSTRAPSAGTTSAPVRRTIRGGGVVEYRPPGPRGEEEEVEDEETLRLSSGGNDSARSSWTRTTSPTWQRVASGRFVPVGCWSCC